ncbi:MAG: tRNA pseudouridine(55) synthase TruB [Erysipelotrichales bacterium]
MNGIILVNKEAGMTSHDVIFKLRKILKTKKIGHCGTLDPLAKGVLVCLVNNATKLSNFLVLDSKEYTATFKLGEATTTQDLAGEVVETKEYQNEYSKEDILKVLEQYKGKQMQTPSIYSAIKVNGKKLYEYARANQEVEIPTREINIYDIKLIDFENDLITINVKCSSGTYIRSLCYDIANTLNYPGVLTNLVREQSGSFKIEDAYTLDQIRNEEYQLIGIKEAMDDYQQVILDDDKIKDVKNGKQLEIDIDNRFIVLDKEGNVIAIYERSIDGKAKVIRGLW